MGLIPSHGTWSVARSAAFRACPRGFLFRYAAGGEPDGREARLLKRLTTPRLEAGSIVHDLIVRAMRAYRDDGELLSGLADEGERLYRERVAASLEVCAYLRETGRLPSGDLTKFVGFVHDLHGLELGAAYGDEVVSRLRACLDHFEASELWAVLRGLGPERWEPLPEDGFGSAPTFTSGRGVRIWARWDFVGTDEDGTIHIVDWKTGRETEGSRGRAMFQLGVYASWAARTMGVSLCRVRVHPAFLAEVLPPWNPVEVRPEARQALAERVHADVHREAGLLERRDDGREGEILWARRERFPATPETRMCLECGWLSICPEGKETCGHVPVRR